MKTVLFSLILAFSLVSLSGCASTNNDTEKSSKCGSGKCGDSK